MKNRQTRTLQYSALIVVATCVHFTFDFVIIHMYLILVNIFIIDWTHVKMKIKRHYLLYLQKIQLAYDTSCRNVVYDNSYSLLIASLLLLSNDIELNPGPLCNLGITHLNVRSLRNKIDVIDSELSHCNILCLTETHLSPNISDDVIVLSSYSKKIHRRDRRTGPGGGVIIYCKDSVFSKRRIDLENDDIEIIWIEVKIDCHTFLLGCLYRPESSIAYWSKLDTMLETVIGTDMNVIITGDINVNMLNIEQSPHLNHLLIKHNLTNLVTEPTRITPTTSTLLDVVLTNNISIIQNTVVHPPICSDHSVVSFDVLYSIFKQKSYISEKYIFHEADFESMNTELASIDWNTLSSTLSVDELNQYLLDCINDLNSRFVPVKKITIRPNDKPWMNREIKLKIRQRNRVHKKARSGSSQQHWENYRQKRNEVIDLIRKAKKTYYENLEKCLCDKTLPPSKWWKIANSVFKTNNKSVSLPPLNDNGSYISHPFDKAECLNTYFTSISTSSANLEPLPPVIPNTHLILDNIIISEQDVKDQLSVLNDKKPPGPDKLSPKIIKMLAPSIYLPLTILFNKTLETGTIPSLWKSANVSAIYKGKVKFLITDLSP